VNPLKMKTLMEIKNSGDSVEDEVADGDEKLGIHQFDFLVDAAAEPHKCAALGCAQMKTLMEMENSGFIALIEGQKYEDLGRMYTLFKRVPGGLDLLRATMGGYIRATGKELVQACLLPSPSLLTRG